MQYREIIENGAKLIEALAKRAAMSGEPVFVYALFTTEFRNGQIVAVTGWDANPETSPPVKIGEYEILRTPRGDRWECIPYADIFPLLYEAARRSPILPKCEA